jgi:hypothetical protein
MWSIHKLSFFFYCLLNTDTFHWILPSNLSGINTLCLPADMTKQNKIYLSFFLCLDEISKILSLIFLSEFILFGSIENSFAFSFLFKSTFTVLINSSFIPSFLPSSFNLSARVIINPLLSGNVCSTISFSSIIFKSSRVLMIYLITVSNIPSRAGRMSICLLYYSYFPLSYFNHYNISTHFFENPIDIEIHLLLELYYKLAR